MNVFVLFSSRRDRLSYALKEEIMRQFGGSWSESKLDCVEKYAAAYLSVMKNQQRYDLHYVDAFAGCGKQALKSNNDISSEALELESFFGDESDRADTEAFLEGSVLRVLNASRSSTRSFNKFILIDANKSSCSELRSVIDTEFPEIRSKVNIFCEDANKGLEKYIKSVNWGSTRALVFLDPFGLEVRWETIIQLAGTEACDVWYLFPLGGVIRMMKNDGRISDLWQARIDRLFGTHDWYDEFYSTTLQHSLFGLDEDVIHKDASTEHVVDYVRKRLLGAFTAVSEAGILRNRKGFPLFALLLGVSNPGTKARDAALRIGDHLVKGL